MNHIQQFVTQYLEKPLSQTDLQLLAKNFQFRNGPCDICGGPCFCLADDNMLVDRLVDPTFPKPVGCFVFTSRRDANLFQKTLNVPLTTWQGRNRWGMYIVVATARPTATINGLNGTIDSRSSLLSSIHRREVYLEGDGSALRLQATGFYVIFHCNTHCSLTVPLTVHSRSLTALTVYSLTHTTHTTHSTHSTHSLHSHRTPTSLIPKRNRQCDCTRPEDISTAYMLV